MVTWGKRWLRDKLGAVRRMASMRPFLASRRSWQSRWSDVTLRAKMKSEHVGKTLTIAAAGVIGAAVIAYTVTAAHQQYIESHTNEIFHVYIGEEKVGTVSDPFIVQDYLEHRQAQLQAEYPDVHMVLQAEPITYESETGFKLTSEDGAALQRIDDQIKASAIGVDLWVDGQFIGIVKDQETADAILARIESKYVPPQIDDVSVLSFQEKRGAGKGSLKSVEFVEEVKVNSVMTEPDQIMDPDDVVARLENSSMKPTTYTVQPGDCVSCIAEKFSISRQIIYENNPWIEDDFINVGDQLDLTVHQPVLSVRTVEEVQEMTEIRYPTQYIQDDTLRQGRTELVQKGKEGRKRLVYNVTKINGQLVDEQLIDEQVIEEAVPEIIKRGTKIIPGEGTGSFRWPVVSPKVTSGYGTRWGSLHKGIDMVSDNRSILAADNGVVEVAEYNRGYGNYIKINHNNGYHTLYAHLSRIDVKKGDKVLKGDVIGRMGTTGHSTGVHLHFEIHKNGAVQNPSNYLNR